MPLFFCVLSSPTITVGLSSSLARILLFFFITRSIFGISQLFLRLNLLENSNEKNAYKPSILGLTVLPGRPFFICFGNCISLNAFLSEFQLLRLVTSLAVLLLTSGLWNVQLILAWHFVHFGAAQPQLVSIFVSLFRYCSEQIRVWFCSLFQ